MSLSDRAPRRAGSSLVKAAIRSVIPADGTPLPITELRDLVRATCPTVADGTTTTALADMATDRELVRVGWGYYRRGDLRQ